MSYWKDGGNFSSPEEAERVARRQGVDPRDYKIQKTGEGNWQLDVRANQDRSDDEPYQGRKGF